ncbi:GDSL-type esterase/lipase family protein [Verrucomicrobiota bacterium]
MKIKNAAVFLVSVMLAGTVFGQIKVACMGDSITAGFGVKNKRTHSYPSRLSELMGEKYDVRNFGASGRTLLRGEKEAYLATGQYKKAQEFNGDIITFKLGTNDSKAKHWANKDNMEKDLNAWIDDLRNANSNVVIYLCLPVPVFSRNGGDREGKGINSQNVRDILPVIKKVAKDRKTKLIDLHTPLLSHPEYFPDGVHPNEEGALAIAKEIHMALTKDKKSEANKEKE